MDTLRKGAFVLSVLVVPVSCSGDFFSEPVICYFLDAFLIIYCIIVTGFFFREKFSKYPAVGVPEQEQNGIYQELERPNDADPYEVLDPSKRKKKAGKKKKRVTEKDPFESLIPSTSSPPPLSPH
ncbi:T-cell surface glycoprotein CD3 zeta chain-like isoform X2 [Archocentrus centrarchus]|uniref:T-cell surface glycoprotein CD3 zeta chain-like isoform X2 n=1 Tax=Archocentrus centrarchus TaxID=63155 RepID=UPI0011E9FBC9|nr:T-cell surface glycoprotein CD3 zeta chain-like isoform X2 [Archocentrus centrarchus]